MVGAAVCAVSWCAGYKHAAELESSALHVEIFVRIRGLSLRSVSCGSWLEPAGVSGAHLAAALVDLREDHGSSHLVLMKTARQAATESQTPW